MADRIETTHVGSLPRTAKLLEFSQQRSPWREVRPGRLRPGTQGRRGRCRPPPEGGRRRPHQRRRVRSHDGVGLRLRLVVVVCGQAAVRRRGHQHRALDDDTGGAHQSADGPQGFRGRQLARAPGHDQVPGGLHGPALRVRAARAVHDRPQPAGQRPDQVHGTGGDQARYREPQGRPQGRGRQGRLDELDRAGELRAHAERVLQDRRGAVVRLRRRDARGVQGDHRRRTERAARRSGDRRELGSAEGRAERRGLPALHQDCASMRSTTRSRDCRRTRSASTSAGEAGMARIPPTSRCSISST